MVVSMPLCHSSRATVRSHGPPFRPYLARTALVSTPGRKCAGVVPSGTDSTGTLRSSIARTSSARSAVHRLIATTTAALPMMLAAVPRLKRLRRIFSWIRSSSVPYTMSPYGTRCRAASQRAGYPAGFSSAHQTNPGRRCFASARARHVQSASPCAVRSRVARMPTRSMVCGKWASLAALPSYAPVETTRVSRG